MTENIRTDRALRDAKNKLRELEKELKRKDKALAEAAALLILREKFNALWDNSEEDCPLSWSGIKLFLLSVKLSLTAPGKVRLVGVSINICSTHWIHHQNKNVNDPGGIPDQQELITRRR